MHEPHTRRGLLDRTADRARPQGQECVTLNNKRQEIIVNETHTEKSAKNVFFLRSCARAKVNQYEEIFGSYTLVHSLYIRYDLCLRIISLPYNYSFPHAPSTMQWKLWKKLATVSFTYKDISPFVHRSTRVQLRLVWVAQKHAHGGFQ